MCMNQGALRALGCRARSTAEDEPSDGIGGQLHLLLSAVAFVFDDDQFAVRPGLMKQPRGDRGPADIVPAVDEHAGDVGEFADAIPDARTTPGL